MNVLRQLRELPRSVRVLFAATLINRCGTMVLPYLALYVTQGLGEGAEAAGTVLSAYGVGAIVAPTIAGWLVDRFGALRVMRGSLLASGFILLAYPLTPHDISTLAALTFVLSLIAEGFRPASLAVVAETVPSAQRKAAFTVLRLAINLGMSIGPSAGGLLAMTSFRALFYVDGATSIAAGIVLILVPWSDASGAIESRPASLAETPTEAHPSLGGTVARGRMAFARFLMGTLLLALVFFQFESSLPLFMVRDIGSSEALYGTLIGLNAVIIIFAEIPLNLKMADWPHPRSMALGTLFTAVGFGVLAFGKNLPLVFASVPVWTIGEMIVLPATSAFVSDLAPPGRAGSFMGLYTTAFGLGFALGPFAGIYALEHFGGTVLWSSAFLLGLAAMGLFAGLPSPQRDGAPSAVGVA